MNQDELNRFVTDYYEHGSPDKAVEALKFVANPGRPEHLNFLPITLYFLRRLADNHPELIRGYQTVLSQVEESGRGIILTLLRLVGDDETRDFLKLKMKEEERNQLERFFKELLDEAPALAKNAMEVPVKTALDLDLLWAEFFVTRNREAVIRVMEVLLWPDLIRKKLQDWLDATPPQSILSPAEWRRRWTLDRIRKATGITTESVPVVNSTRYCQRVMTDYDLDCQCTMEGIETVPGRLDNACQAFPFPLSDDDRMYIVVKSAAKWSLGVNAMEHQKVFDVCREESNDEEGKFGSHEEVNSIVLNAIACLGEDAPELFEEDLSELLEKAPGLVEEDAEFSKLSALINLSRETGTQGTQMGVDDAKNIIKQCVEVTGAARSYCSRKILRDFTSERDYDIKWRLDFVKPDRFHLHQTLWDGKLFLVDEFVTVGDQHYRSGGLWFQLDDMEVKEQDSQLGHSLLVDNILKTLRTQEFVSSETYLYQSTKYLLLKYEIIESDDLPTEGLEDEGLEDSEMCIWIDLATHLLAKGETYVKGQTLEGEEIHVVWQHAFAAYNEQIEVRPPSGLQGTESEEKGAVIEVLPFHR